MHPYVFHVGHVSLPTFGVLAAVGLMLALALSEKTARLARLDPERVWDAGIFAVLAAFVLSRVLLVVANFAAFKAVPVLLLAVPSLTPMGLLLTAIATGIWLWIKRLSLLRVMDAWAPCAALVWGFLGLGHVAEGSDPGVVVARWGIRAPGSDTLLVPVAMFAALAGFALALSLFCLLRRGSDKGLVAGAGLAAAGVAQVLLSFVRQPGLELTGWLEPLEWVGIGMVLMGGLLLACATASDNGIERLTR